MRVSAPKGPFFALLTIVAWASTGCCKLDATQAAYYQARFGDGAQIYDYARVLEQWRALAQGAEPDSREGAYRSMCAGACDDGSLVFIAGNDLRTGVSLFFDAQSGAFVGLSTWSGAMDSCGGRRHWPKQVSFERCVVSEVLRGRAVKIGQAIVP